MFSIKIGSMFEFTEIKSYFVFKTTRKFSLSRMEQLLIFIIKKFALPFLLLDYRTQTDFTLCYATANKPLDT